VVQLFLLAVSWLVNGIRLPLLETLPSLPSEHPQTQLAFIFKQLGWDLELEQPQQSEQFKQFQVGLELLEEDFP
jgi:hypothetical protein